MNEKVIAIIIVVPLVILLLLGIDFALWKLYCWFMPQLFPSGSIALIKPGFWVFVAATTFFSFLFRGIVPNNSNK